MEAKVLTTPQLTRAIEAALDKGYKRQLRRVVIDKLDPDGMHVVFAHMMTDDQFTSDPKVRAWIYVKFKGDDEPHEGVLDINVGTFVSYEARDVPELEE